MTRDELIDALKGKEGKPISIHHLGGTIMGIFEYLIWDTSFPDVKGIRLVDNDVLVKPANIVEIKDAPMYSVAVDLMGRLKK